MGKWVFRIGVGRLLEPGDRVVNARLQQVAEPGLIVMSYETYALVKDIVVARPRPPITMKGVTHEVVPYVVERQAKTTGEEGTVVSEHTTGLNLRLDLGSIQDADIEHVNTVLHNAIAALAIRKVTSAMSDTST